MEKSSKIYVAGASGLVGSSAVLALKAHGYSTILAPSRTELDLSDQNAVATFFETERPEYVVLAAARVGGIKVNQKYSADFLFENLTIQQNVIWSAHLNNVKKLLFLGSSCIYPREAPQPMSEDSFMAGPLEPTNEGYAIAKIAGIKLCEKIYEQYGTPFISCMPTNVYGERDHFDSERGHVIPALMQRMHEAKISHVSEISVWGSGNARREFLHVRDLAEAIVFLLEKYEGKQFLNIGTGKDVSIKELASLVKDVVGYEGTIVYDTKKPDGMPRKLLDVSKINALGWSAHISLAEGLAATYEWYKANTS